MLKETNVSRQGRMVIARLSASIGCRAVSRWRWTATACRPLDLRHEIEELLEASAACGQGIVQLLHLDSHLEASLTAASEVRNHLQHPNLDQSRQHGVKKFSCLDAQLHTDHVLIDLIRPQ